MEIKKVLLSIVALLSIAGSAQLLGVEDVCKNVTALDSVKQCSCSDGKGGIGTCSPREDGSNGLYCKC